ncbi:unnamed protein product [Caenorhabditis brenneri]
MRCSSRFFDMPDQERSIHCQIGIETHYCQRSIVSMRFGNMMMYLNFEQRNNLECYYEQSTTLVIYGSELWTSLDVY